ncbi:unnamed protein product [Rhizophagus irregularis]|nr:unnamed protein product [Rhizophagus irregularis]
MCDIPIGDTAEIPDIRFRLSIDVLHHLTYMVFRPHFRKVVCSSKQGVVNFYFLRFLSCSQSTFSPL